VLPVIFVTTALLISIGDFGFGAAAGMRPICAFRRAVLVIGRRYVFLGYFLFPNSRPAYAQSPSVKWLIFCA